MAKARKEIDKESMYQKIMPSSIRATAAEETPAPAPKRPVTPRPPRKTATPGRPVPTFPDADSDEDEVPLPPKASPMASPASARAPAHRPSVPDAPRPAPWVEPPSAEKPAIANIMERLIDVKIDLAMDKFHCCTCDKCHQDITAFALNKLSPRYIVAEPELLEAAMADKEANTQVTTALVQAILKIKANPNH